MWIAVKRLGTLLTLAYVGVPSAALAATPVTVEHVLAAWKQRQERTRSFHCEWTERFTETVATLPEIQRFRTKEQIDPNESRTEELRWTIVCDGGRVRFSYKGISWSPRQGDYLDQPYTATFDGKTNLSHFDRGEPGAAAADRSYAFINEGEFGERTNYRLTPLLLHYRALDPQLSPLKLKGGDLAVSGTRGIVDGCECVLIEKKAGDGRVKEQYWSDPKRGYSVLRCTVLSGAKVWLSIDTTFEPDGEAGWAPKGWTAVVRGGTSTNKVRESCRATVTSRTLNPPVAKEEFEVSLPADTYVLDARDRTEYVLRANGEKRLVTEEELKGGASFEAILRTESGMALRDASAGSWIWWFAAACVALVVGVILLRRRISRRG